MKVLVTQIIIMFNEITSMLSPVVTINMKFSILLVFAVIYATVAVKNELTIRTVLISPALRAVMLVIS